MGKVKNMLFDPDRSQVLEELESLREVARIIGFSPADMEDLIASELSIDEVLDFIHAVRSNRMN